ncbi:hypothetical protein [Nonomuraea zeae]|uniref:Uncharacterized protein n=1 Tax=Nonomuraea zeae TaxID=1642303 RepID=A0A5S4F3V1_9ACTN|nr:hypothetical protein [Nonomuraea zeae]TMR10827.1 hypothetical protein ETD85_60015 [Nonomuraea zeae]
MRRALRYVAIWCGATVVAVSVSWFGVRGVLRSEFVDDVDVEPFLAQTIAADPDPLIIATPTPSPRRSTKNPKNRASPTPSARKPVKVITVKGGEVAFTLGPGGCRLVSATPVSGYTAKVARADGWIRVDLARGGHGTGVFCISHEQRTDTWEY